MCLSTTYTNFLISVSLECSVQFVNCFIGLDAYLTENTLPVL